jgi:hypothetical protein
VSLEINVKDLSKKNTILTNELSSMKDRIASLSLKPGSNKSLLVGSSLIRNVDSEKLSDTTVVSLSGGTITQIKEKIESQDDDFGTITVVCGGNDIDSGGKTVQEALDDYSLLIDAAKSRVKDGKVVISSVLPRYRPDKPNLQEEIDTMNVGLNVLCSDKNASFIDNSSSFKLLNSCLNEGFYIQDGQDRDARIHLTKSGTNYLAKNLKLKMKTPNVFKPTNGKSNRRNDNTNTVGTTQEDDFPPLEHTFWDTARRKGRQVQRQRSQQQRELPHQPRESQTHVPTRQPQPQVPSRQPPRAMDYSRAVTAYGDRDFDQYYDSQRCGFCAEYNHSTSECGFQNKVRCRQCSRLGHKQKFCVDFRDGDYY